MNKFYKLKNFFSELQYNKIKRQEVMARLFSPTPSKIRKFFAFIILSNVIPVAYFYKYQKGTEISLTRFLSSKFGNLARHEFNPSFQQLLNSGYIKFSGANLEESEQKEFPSLDLLFTRKLKEGVRKISGDKLTSPCDGYLVNTEIVDMDRQKIARIKGIEYSLPKLLTDKENFLKISKKNPENQVYCTHIYLSPGDCHRFWSPVDWKIKHRKHLIGFLSPVWTLYMKHINKEALARNERVVYFGEWEHGFFAMAIVGAYNVGSIEINFDQTNTGVTNSEISLQKELKKGDEVGCFHMGSAITLVFEAPPNFKFIENSQVSLGQSILLSK